MEFPWPSTVHCTAGEYRRLASNLPPEGSRLQSALLSREAIEYCHRGQCPVLIVKEPAYRQRTLHRRLPPENPFSPAIGSFHDDAIQLIEKFPLPLCRFGKRRGLVGVVTRLPVVGRFHHDDVLLVFGRHELQIFS